MQEAASGAANEPGAQTAHLMPTPGPLADPGLHLVHQSVPTPDEQLAGHVPAAGAGFPGMAGLGPALVKYASFAARLPGGQRSSLRNLSGSAHTQDVCSK